MSPSSFALRFHPPTSKMLQPQPNHCFRIKRSAEPEASARRIFRNILPALIRLSRLQIAASRFHLQHQRCCRPQPNRCFRMQRSAEPEASARSSARSFLLSFACLAHRSRPAPSVFNIEDVASHSPTVVFGYSAAPKTTLGSQFGNLLLRRS